MRQPATSSTLSKVELAILAGVAEGRTNGDIAQGLNLATGTVKKYLAEICAKLGARDRTNAAAIAYRRGLIV
jgi:DNA-binding NarL/FixJ family response regulator